MSDKMNNPEVLPLRKPILLSSGALVEFSYMANGAQAADIKGREMTNTEYDEFTLILIKK